MASDLDAIVHMYNNHDDAVINSISGESGDSNMPKIGLEFNQNSCQSDGVVTRTRYDEFSESGTINVSLGCSSEQQYTNVDPPREGPKRWERAFLILAPILKLLAGIVCVCVAFLVIDSQHFNIAIISGIIQLPICSILLIFSLCKRYTFTTFMYVMLVSLAAALTYILLIVLGIYGSETQSNPIVQSICSSCFTAALSIIIYVFFMSVFIILICINMAIHWWFFRKSIAKATDSNAQENTPTVEIVDLNYI